MESVLIVLLLLKIIRVMCLVWGCNRIEIDSFNAKMVHQQGVARADHRQDGGRIRLLLSGSEAMHIEDTCYKANSISINSMGQ